MDEEIHDDYDDNNDFEESKQGSVYESKHD